MSHENERARLRRELSESRRQLSGDLSELGHAMNVRERLQDAVRRHPAWWIGGGLVGGVILANLLRLPSRDRHSRDNGAADSVKPSLFLGLLGIAGKQILRLSEPALKRYAQQEIERWMGVSRSDSGPEIPPSRSPEL
ncbi:MAG: hypothetical protein KDN19_11815 [Verrucomicrobiae bacterium]|nr:hypothetical protein [Verrucomicrobiae bacterium]